VVFTNDLDFSALLAHTAAAGPSVVQTRHQGLLPDAVGTLVVDILREAQSALEQGAIVAIDREQMRTRVLPLGAR
jgi:predicted nuclease of predicted toxin-antitoxin system